MTFSIPRSVADIANLGAKTGFYSGLSLSSAQTTYYQVNFGFITQGIYLRNRGTGIVQYSFDGTTLHGELFGTGDVESVITYDKRHQDGIFLKNANNLSGTNTIRLEAW